MSIHVLQTKYFKLANFRPSPNSCQRKNVGQVPKLTDFVLQKNTALGPVYLMIWKMLLQLQLVKVFICSAVGSMGLARFFDEL